MVLNSLSFCLSVKLLISPSYLNEILAGYSNRRDSMGREVGEGFRMGNMRTPMADSC